MLLGIYLSIFFLSSAGIIFIFWRSFSEVKKMSSEELALRFNSSRSVRKDVFERYFVPLRTSVRSKYVPAFWRLSEIMVRGLRGLTSKFGKKLDNLSDNLRGRQIDMKIGERSQYWQTLNGAKNGAVDVHESKEEHNKALPVEKDTEKKENLPG